MALKKPPGALRGDPPHEVFPYLFIGSAANAANKSELSSLGITHILNLKECYFANTPNEFTFLHVAMSDYGNQDIKEVLPECFEFIQSAKSAGGKVLVHCRGGVNRSATVVLAWLMFAEKMRLKEAWVLLRSKRAVVSPHEGYVQQLKSYEKELFGSITLTEEDHGISTQEKLRQFMMMGKKATAAQAGQSAQAGQPSASSGRPPMLGALKRSADPAAPDGEDKSPPESPSKDQLESTDSLANHEEAPKEKHKKKSSREKSTRSRSNHSTTDTDSTTLSHRSADLSENTEVSPKKSKSKGKLPANEEDEDEQSSPSQHTAQPSIDTDTKTPSSKRSKKKRDHGKGSSHDESLKADEVPHRAPKKPRPSTSSSSQQPAQDSDSESNYEEREPQSDPAPSTGLQKKTNRPKLKLASMIVGIFSKKGSEVR